MKKNIRTKNKLYNRISEELKSAKIQNIDEKTNEILNILEKDIKLFNKENGLRIKERDIYNSTIKRKILVD